MLEVVGLRGLSYNTARVGPLDNVVTPPYDVISQEERAALQARSPYNLVHVLLPEADDDGSYGRAGKRFDQWLDEGVFAQEADPHFYLLRQHFTDLDGERQVRCGFFGRVRLPETGSRTILGHEQTFNRPFEDRLRLTEATRANLGAIFSLYADPEGVLTPFLDQMNQQPPIGVATTIDGVMQECWAVPYDAAVTDFFRGKTLYIADGHHRYQTACVYRDRLREANPDLPRQPFDYALMGFVSFDDPGLKIYPPHRVLAPPNDLDAGAFLRALDRWFDVTPVTGGLPEAVEKHPGRCVIGLALAGKGEHLLVLRDVDRKAFLGDDRGPAWRDLDVAVLHRGIIEGILHVPADTQFVYEKNAQRAVKAARSGDPGLAFILRGTPAEQICACAEAGEAMPQKSTYFFPKLPSGMVIHQLK